MTPSDLEIFNHVPFLFWVKDADGTYLWGNKVISDLAGENVVGKKDSDLVWGRDAGGLVRNDNQLLETGKTEFVHEYIAKSSRGPAKLNVCKWVEDFEGQKREFGISFIIDEI